MSSSAKWAIVALVAAVLLAGGGALAAYLIRTSSQREYAAWHRAADSLATIGAKTQQRHDDSIMRVVVAATAAAQQHAGTGAHHDSVVIVDSGSVVVLRDSLHRAQSAADSLHAYPPLVTGLEHQVGDVTTARDEWHLAYTGERTAATHLLERVVSDSLWGRRILAHLDSAPKPPRGSLLKFLMPKPYAKAEWGRQSGFEVRAGVCAGACGP